MRSEPTPSLLLALAAIFASTNVVVVQFCDGLSPHDGQQRLQQNSRRDALRNILAATTTVPLWFCSSNAVHAWEGDPPMSPLQKAVTASSLGQSVRRTTVQGARIMDSIDEQWERFSDQLRDQNKCDENTNRRLFDNGVRRDGTRVGNPVLGALCQPEPILPLDVTVANQVLQMAQQAALSVPGEAGSASQLTQQIQQVQQLVQPSFDRSIQLKLLDISDEEERRRLEYNFQAYCTFKAISNQLPRNSISSFQSKFGSLLLSQFAPNADKRNYHSPFPEMNYELEDYDYNKDQMIDSLGALQVTLDRFKAAGLASHYEISIPYDDYGSVVTVAIDNDVTLGSDLLLLEQGSTIGGPYQAVARAALERAQVTFGMDSFFIDPSTTRQRDYNPTQLLLSVNNLEKLTELLASVVDEGTTCFFQWDTEFGGGFIFSPNHSKSKKSYGSWK
eukprot:CAMPEP_0168724330 /NCGR_PEP_ID=MMETSP0724-20121128/3580_1 /TAXON_ID=265536 /ORGANISM="Amphiprora sp., Strain CCMP467" /LENGTH=446 /DNA_ID=CAMNT_0008771075 /DNA_START=18 /DNA_END=1359 /DNA_ORIENTATION=+